MVKRVGQNIRTVGKGAITVAKESAKLSKELARTLIGASERDVPLKDPRFADPAWRENPMYRRLGQSYLTFCDTIDRLAGDNPHWRDRERARFLGGILTSTLSPTNTLWGNPAALKRAVETGGLSLLSGMRNMVGDIVARKGLPSQVNSAKFKVGENLATTPGAVIFRNEMLEIIQYQPMTTEVSERPTLLILPPIGKYYFMDLAPGRSFIEYAVSKGMPMFATSWRNPGPEHGHWGLDDYVQSMLDAVDAVCDVAESQQLNVLGMCAGGIMTTIMLSVMAARRDKRVSAAAFGVMMPDVGAESPIGGMNIAPVLSMAKQTSSSKGILPASSLAGVFAWMRPNDLVWNYWTNNYLMGRDPPAFDILAWSVDGTNLPSKLHEQFIEIFEGNPLSESGALRVLGVPIDLKRIRIDTFATGALTDHLTPWKACYRATQLFGGRSTFVLSNSGHIASLVNPPGNPKSTYWTGPKPVADPDRWLQSATQHQGTWWDVWVDWNLKRSGDQRAASFGPGSDRYPALVAAPGTYVHQKA